MSRFVAICAQYSQMLPQLEEDQWKFTAKLDAIKSALERNEHELQDLRVVTFIACFTEI